MRAIAGVVLVVSLLVTGCTGNTTTPCGGRGRLTGIVLDVESRSLTDVRAFTMRSQGEECEILIDPDRKYGFPLPHLNDHKVAADPVLVEVEERDGELVALSIDDLQN